MRWIAALFLIVPTLSFSQPISLVTSEVVESEYSEYVIALENAIAQSGLRFSQIVVPEQRYARTIQNGTADVIALASASQLSTSPYLLVQPAVTHANIFMYYHQDLDLDNLENKTMAIVDGTAFNIPPEESLSLNRIGVRSNEAALKMVNSGRADMTFLSSSGTLILAKLELTDVKRIDEPVSFESFHIGVLNTQPELVTPLTEIIIKLRQEGSYRFRYADGKISRPTNE